MSTKKFYVELAKYHSENKKEVVSKLEAKENTSRGTTDSIINKAISHLKNKEIDLTVNTLCNHFENRKGAKKFWNELEELAINLLIDVVLVTNRVSKLSRTFERYCARSTRGTVPPIELAVEYLISRLGEMLTGEAAGEGFLPPMAASPTADGTKKDFAYTKDETDDNTSALGLILGLTTEEDDDNTAVAATGASAVESAIKMLFGFKNGFGPLGTVAGLRKGMSLMIDLCETHHAHLTSSHKFPFNTPISRISTHLGQFCGRIFTAKPSNPDDWSTTATHRREAIKKENATMILECRFKVLEVALRTSDWITVNISLKEVTNLEKRLTECVKEQNRINKDKEKIESCLEQISVHIRRSSLEAEVFLSSQNWIFLAHTMQRLYSISGTSSSATGALISTLCVSMSDDDVVNRKSLFRDNEKWRLNQIANLFHLSLIPSRGALLANATKLNIQKHSNADVSALFNIVINAESNGVPIDIDDIYKHLNALQKVPELAQYICALERAFLEFFMYTHFKTNGVLSMSLFQSHTQLFPRENDLYIIATARGAMVDTVSGVARFKTTEAAIDQKREELKKSIAIVASRGRIIRKPVVINACDIEDEKTHIIHRHELQTKCMENTDKVVEVRNKGIKKKKLDAEAKKLEREREAHRKVCERSLQILQKKVEDAEDVLRRTRAIEMLESKYKNLTVEKKVTGMKTGAFIEAMTRKLAAYKKKFETYKADSSREAHYFEKALREKDIPKRKELGETQKEQNRKDQDKRRENYLQQHRVNYDAKLALKKRFATESFQTAVSEYESNTILKAEKDKPVTKRDAEEANLEAAREALRRRETVNAPAAAVSVPAVESSPIAVTATKTEEPTVDAPAPAKKWMPKSRTT